jgi:hypothetical protein
MNVCMYDCMYVCMQLRVYYTYVTMNIRTEFLLLRIRFDRSQFQHILQVIREMFMVSVLH